MKKLALYLMLLLSIPATAQSGHFGNHSHHSHHPHNTAEHHHNGTLTHHGPTTPTPPMQGMAPEDFELAHRFLAEKTFDSDRLETAKDIVRHNRVSASQIASICLLFTYDSNRLDFAKYAYASCVNKGLYFVVDETFTFRSSRDELHEYIRRF